MVKLGNVPSFQMWESFTISFIDGSPQIKIHMVLYVTFYWDTFKACFIPDIIYIETWKLVKIVYWVHLAGANSPQQVFDQESDFIKRQQNEWAWVTIFTLAWNLTPQNYQDGIMW